MDVPDSSRELRHRFLICWRFGQNPYEIVTVFDSLTRNKCLVTLKLTVLFKLCQYTRLYFATEFRTKVASEAEGKGDQIQKLNLTNSYKYKSKACKIQN